MEQGGPIGVPLLDAEPVDEPEAVLMRAERSRKAGVIFAVLRRLYPDRPVSELRAEAIERASHPPPLD